MIKTIKIGIVTTCLSVLAALGASVLTTQQQSVNAATPAKQMQQGLQDVGATKDNNKLDVGVKKIINMMLYVLGAVAVIMIVYGGLIYTTSNGNAENIKKAKTILIYAVVGLIVALLAYAIVNFVIDSFAK